MAEAVLAYNGLPVLKTTDKYSIQNDLYTDIGTLWSFNLEVKGKIVNISYFKKSDFKKNDKNNCRIGYYKTTSFYDYKNGKLTLEKLQDETEIGFGYKHYLPIHDASEFQKANWGLKLADNGNLINALRLNPEDPYTDYYLNTEYEFKVNNPPGEFLPKRYLSISDYPPLNPDPNSPDYSIATDYPRDLLNTPTGRFYTKNFGDFITVWDITDDSVKEFLSRIVTTICWKISWVADEIGKLTINNLSYIKEAYELKYYQYDDYQYDTLTLADRIVGDLLWSWGYYYYDDNGFIKFDFDPILPTQYTPDYSDILTQYYNALANFYNGIYYKDVEQLFPDDTGSPEEKSNKRVTVLMKILPDIAINLIPKELRIEILESIIGRSEIKEDDDQRINEADVLKILNSFLGYEESNYLLDFLSTVKNGKRTRYEMLYNLMDDDRLGRYPFINWFVDDVNNRQFYNFLLYEKWKTSKYNMYYIPSGSQENENGLNPDAYFLSNEGLRYFKTYDTSGVETGEVEPILEYSLERDSEVGFLYVERSVTYAAASVLDKKKVIISQINTTEVPYLMSSSSSSVYGKYHIYQPIALIGYEGNIDFDVPQFAPIPAFLFFYSTDYNRIKTFDAIIAFTAEVAIEIGLFFATGGLGALRHLKYLKYLNKVGSAFRGVLPAEQAVVVWRGVEAGSEVLSVSAGVLYSTTQLVANTTTSQATYELMQRLGKFFLVLTFTSAGSAVYSRQRAVRGAKEVIQEIDHLSDLGIPHGLSPEVIDVLYTIRNTALIAKTLFRNRIVSLTTGELGEANHIADLYDDLPDAAQTIFYNHFADKAENMTSNLWFWKQMNKTENGITAARMKAWRDMSPEFSFLRRELWFLDNVIFIRGSADLNTEVFIGRAGKVLKEGATPPYQFNDYNWFAKGVHHKDALQATGQGGLGRIVPGSKIDLGNGYYKAKVEVYNPEFPNSGGWKVKPTKGGTSSTFFPDSWTKGKTQEMLAYAYKNKKFQKNNIWEGVMTDGITVRFHIDNGVIQSAFPVFN